MQIHTAHHAQQLRAKIALLHTNTGATSVSLVERKDQALALEKKLYNLTWKMFYRPVLVYA